MSFISLSKGKIHEETNTKKLKNFTAGYVGKFYISLAGNIDGTATSTAGSLMMWIYHLAMFKIICSHRATFSRAFKMTLIIK